MKHKGLINRIISLFTLTLISLIPTSSMAIYIINASAQYGHNAQVKWSATITTADACTPYCDSNNLAELAISNFEWDYIPQWFNGRDITTISHDPLVELYDDNNNLMDGFRWSFWDQVWHHLEFDGTDVFHMYNFKNDVFKFYDGISVGASDFADAFSSTTVMQVSSVPEPSAIFLMGIGLITIGLRLRGKV